MYTHKIHYKEVKYKMKMNQYIKQLRESAGMSQEELGKSLTPHVNRAAVQKWEAGAVENLKRTHIEQLAKLFGVKPSNLMCFEDDNLDYPMFPTSDVPQYIQEYIKLDKRDQELIMKTIARLQNQRYKGGKK